MTPMGVLTCPVCAAPLAKGGPALRCPSGHSFDRAREGYVNLLLARGARAAARGDSAAMLHARRSFLEAGHYLPLMAALATAARAAGELRTILDAGCGEGWYLGTLGARLAAEGRRPRLIGTDISRDAARLAARRYPEALVVVTDTTRRLPLAANAVDLLLNIFAPRNPAEFARVLAPGGRLLTVIPAPEHLHELRALLPLLQIEPDKEAETVARLVSGGLRLCGRTAVTFSMALPGAAAAALVAMSPSAHHLTETGQAAAAGLPAMTVTADFVLLSLGHA